MYCKPQKFTCANDGTRIKVPTDIEYELVNCEQFDGWMNIL